MRLLKARFKTRDAFLEAYDDSVPTGGLFCATTTSVAEEDPVVVEIHFPGLPNKMLLRGVAQNWRSAVPRLGVRAGALVVLDAQDRDKIDFIVGVARGELHPNAVKRKHPRLPVEFMVHWKAATASESVAGQLRDISIGGAQLLTTEPLEIEQDIFLELMTPGGAQPISIASKVTCKTPLGYGLRFVYRDSGGSRRLREVMRRLIEPAPGE